MDITVANLFRNLLWIKVMTDDSVFLISSPENILFFLSIALKYINKFIEARYLVIFILCWTGQILEFEFDILFILLFC